MEFDYKNSGKFRVARDIAGKDADERKILIEYLKMGGLVFDGNGGKILSYADSGGKEYVAELISGKEMPPGIEKQAEEPEKEAKEEPEKEIEKSLEPAPKAVKKPKKPKKTKK